MVIGYCRVSTDEQANEGHSIGAQQEMIKRYCELHGLTEPEFVIDGGFSGKDKDRPGLQEVLLRALAGEVEHVVVTAIDRLSRSTRDLLEIVCDVFNGHIGFHSVKQQLDTSSPMGMFVLTMWGALANLEREQIIGRTRDAMREKQRKGERIGRNPYGFNEGPGELVVDDEEMAIVGKMFEMRRNGARIRQIAGWLNDNDIESSRGSLWHASSVNYVLNNPIYEGHVCI